MQAFSVQGEQTKRFLKHNWSYVDFSFLAEQGKSQISFKGTAASCFVFDKEAANTDNPEMLFDRLLHGAAMTNTLGNLRIFLLQAGALFQTGPKRIMLPFINLNEFDFDKEYSYTV